jgi:hypothetical protein
MSEKSKKRNSSDINKVAEVLADYFFEYFKRYVENIKPKNKDDP